MKNKTAGPSWFDLPAPAEADLPRLHREVEALRLHKQLDPKQFYRKEPGEGKGIKGLPKHFAVRPRFLFSSPPPRLPSRCRCILNADCADRQDPADKHALRRRERGQPAPLRAQAHARRRARRRRRGEELRQEEVQGAPDRARREGAGHPRCQKGASKTKMVERVGHKPGLLLVRAQNPSILSESSLRYRCNTHVYLCP